MHHGGEAGMMREGESWSRVMSSVVPARVDPPGPRKKTGCSFCSGILYFPRRFLAAWSGGAKQIKAVRNPCRVYVTTHPADEHLVVSTIVALEVFLRRRRHPGGHGRACDPWRAGSFNSSTSRSGAGHKRRAAVHKRPSDKE